MATSNRNQPTKGLALLMGALGVLLLISQVVAVMFEGRSPSVIFWILVILDIGFVLYCVRAFIKAAKKSSA